MNRNTVRRKARWHEDKGFQAYAKEQYLHAIGLMHQIILDESVAVDKADTLMVALLDKIATPLVYLWDEWDLLDLDEKKKYDPELAERLKASAAISAKAATILGGDPK